MIYFKFLIYILNYFLNDIKLFEILSSNSNLSNKNAALKWAWGFTKTNLKILIPKFFNTNKTYKYFSSTFFEYFTEEKQNIFWGYFYCK